MKKLAILGLVLMLGACQLSDRENKLAISTLVGAAAGATLGWFTIGGGNMGSILGAALIGTAGATAGYLAADYYLPPDDKKAMSDATYQTLASAKMGETKQWGDPKSGSHGTVTATREFVAKNGRICREFVSTVTVGDKAQSFEGSACRLPDGAWQSI